MPDQIDDRIPLQAAPTPRFFGPDMAAVYASQNQAYRNALQQQDLAGQNALRGVFQNQNALNPATGLPNAAEMSSVYRADPKLGLEFTEMMMKLQDQQGRYNLSNLMQNQKINGFFDQDVATPLNTLAEKLQTQGVPQEQQNTILEQERRKAMQDLQSKYGLTDQQIAHLPQKYDRTMWPLQSGGYQKRQELIDKGWDDKKLDYSTDPPTEYSFNRFLNIFTKPDHTTPYTPGTFTDPSKSTKPVRPTEMTPAKVKDDQGNWIDSQVIVKEGGRITTPDNKTLNPDDVKVQLKAATGTVKAAKPVRILSADGKGTEVVFATQGSKPGQPWTDQDGKPLRSAPLSEVHPTDPDWPGASKLEGDPAFEYISERERLGQRVSSTYQMSKPEIQKTMARNDIRNSLGLDKNADITHEDAVAAAMNDVLTQKALKADSSALTLVARQNAQVRSFENTALGNIALIRDMGGKGTAGGDMLWNRFRNASKREIEIDPDMNRLNLLLTDLAGEYSRIMTTAAGTGSMTSDAAREKAASLFNINQPWEVIQGNLKAAEDTMHNRTESIAKEYNSTMDTIRNKGVLGPTGNPADIGKDIAKDSLKGGSSSEPKLQIHNTPEEVKASLQSYPPGNYLLKKWDEGHKHVIGTETWIKNPDGSVTEQKQ